MGAEERLRHQHCHEGQQDAQGTLDSAHLARGSRLASDDENPPGMVHRQVHGVQQPEDDELQTRAVPHARQRHREERGEHDAADESARRADARGAHRQVAVRAPLRYRHRHGVGQGGGDGAGQRHVPARPEIDDAAGLVGRVEVQRVADAEHLGQAQRHVRVA
ncbi:hypothetical protein G6F24_016019 [Rhizopus arrhizus]|nr:hypothetical protein G6F24_016019 [Rhizopus arrhizus]